MAETDDAWIRPLLSLAAERVDAEAVGRDELIAAGRARLARRRVLAGTALTAVLAFAVGGYAIAEGVGGGGGGGTGHVAAVTVSAASATSSAASVRQSAGTLPAPAIS